MKTMSFSSSKRAVFDACLKVLKQLDCIVASKDYPNGVIKAEKGGTLRAFGHTLEIRVNVAETQKTKVKVVSELVGIQVVDWGTNSENEANIIAAIEKTLR